MNLQPHAILWERPAFSGLNPAHGSLLTVNSHSHKSFCSLRTNESAAVSRIVLGLTGMTASKRIASESGVQEVEIEISALKLCLVLLPSIIE